MLSLTIVILRQKSEALLEELLKTNCSSSIPWKSSSAIIALILLISCKLFDSFEKSYMLILKLLLKFKLFKGDTQNIRVI